MKKRRNGGQGLILAFIFVLVAMLLGGLAIFGFWSGNILLGAICSLGEGAWFFAGKNILV